MQNASKIGGLQSKRQILVCLHVVPCSDHDIPVGGIKKERIRDRVIFGHQMDRSSLATNFVTLLVWQDVITLQYVYTHTYIYNGLSSVQPPDLAECFTRFVYFSFP